ncbi:MAG: hypothetical protein LBQ57_07105 [Spirochaetales bacterium]|nr:hypothetical protein [Spirochaetales bacterium]
MKRHVKLSVFLLVLLGVLFTSGCSLGDDDDGPGYTDNPLTGSLTAATAAKIFDYTENTDGVTIDKFKDADALEDYLNLAPRGAKDLATTRFIIGTINRKPVTAIGAGAFDESEGAAALPDELQNIKLPDTITDVGAGAFNITVSIDLLIPETVLTVLAENDPAILYEISQSVTITIKKVTAESEEGEELDAPPPQAYKIVMADMTNGTVTASPKSGFGTGSETITLTVSPDTGRRLKENGLRVFYGEAPETAVTLTAGENNVYTFTLPAYDVTVSAEFEEIPADGPIQINSAADMAKIGNLWPTSGEYILAANITLPGGWTPLGTGTAPFSGVFDGAGHTITLTGFDTAGVVGNSWSVENQLSGYPVAAGIFSYTESASIKNLTVAVNTNVSFEINSDNDLHFIGIVAGLAENTTFRDVIVSGSGVFKAAKKDGDGVLMFGGIAGVLEACEVYGCVVNLNLEAEVTGEQACVGGLAGFGWLEGSLIENSAVEKNVKATGTLSDTISIGGLAGAYSFGHIKNSYMEGDVYAELTYTGARGGETLAGGLLGRHDSDIIENSHAKGDVTAISTEGDAVTAAGGLTGYTSDESEGITQIKNSYASGTVQATANTGCANAGGIAGRIRYGKEVLITDSYASGDVTADGSSSMETYEGALAGGITGRASDPDSGGALSIKRCYASGNIAAKVNSSSMTFAGGIIGKTNSNDSGTHGGSLTVEQCYTSGGVNAAAGSYSAYAGGIIGVSNINYGSLSIAQCYAKGNISSTGNGGGIMGGIWTGSGNSISNCAALSGSVTNYRIAPPPGVPPYMGITLANNIALDTMTLTGNSTITSDPAGAHGESKTSAELSQQATYIGLGWDFTSTWEMQGGYPVLK